VVCLDQRLRHRPPWFASDRAVDRYRWVVSSLQPSSFEGDPVCMALVVRAMRDRREVGAPAGIDGVDLSPWGPSVTNWITGRWTNRWPCRGISPGSSWAIPGPAIDPNASSVAAISGPSCAYRSLPSCGVVAARRTTDAARRSVIAPALGPHGVRARPARLRATHLGVRQSGHPDDDRDTVQHRRQFQTEASVDRDRGQHDEHADPARVCA
jgi:hypothetical protein